jgi:dolichol-phosphate mannosyltransferase
MSLAGIGIACLGFLYALFLIGSTLLVGVPVEGWSSLMVAILVVGGLQITMLGVLGEYLWRALDEARRRPRYNVECSAGDAPYASPAPDQQRSRLPRADADRFAPI